MPTRLITLTTTLALAAASFALPALAAEEAATTDIGTLDKETAEQAFKQAALLALRGPQLSHAPVLRRHASAHRRSRWTPARSAARLGPRDAYRFARGEEVTASSGQPVKLSRPLDFLVVADHSDNMGFFPRSLAGDPEMLADPHGPQMVRHDPVGQGRGGGDRDHRQLLARAIPEGAAVSSPARRPIARPGRRRSRRPRRRTSRAASPPSSATSGPRTPAATTCTATSSSATTATRPARSSRTPRITPLGSDNPRDLWKWMAAYEEKTGGERARHRAQRQPEQRPHVPDHRVVHRQADRPRVRRDAREVGARSTKPRRSRATARRIRSSRRTTSSPTSSAGTRATST